MKKTSIIFLAASFAALPLMADDDVRDQFNPVMTAVVSQSIAPDARAGGMGDVGAATDPDVHSQYWNPAKYPFTISRAGFAINYTPWLRKLTTGIALLDAVGYIRLGEYQALSGSVRYFTLGEVQAGKDMTVKPYELGVDVAYSRMLSEKFSAAVALRYMYSDITGHYDDNMNAGSAFAADIALFYNNYVMMGQRECQLSWGLNISNIGSKINYGDDYSYFIPTNLRLGLSYMIPLNEYNRITFSADANKLLVPSKPIQGTDESNEDYEERIRKDYYDMSSISGIFKSFGDRCGIHLQRQVCPSRRLPPRKCHARQPKIRHSGCRFPHERAEHRCWLRHCHPAHQPDRPDAARFPRIRFRRHTRPPRQTPLKPRLNTHSLTSHTPKTL